MKTRKRLFLESLEARNLLAADLQADFCVLSLPPKIPAIVSPVVIGHDTSGVIPALHSDPSATAKLYLNFGGDFRDSWAGFNNVTTPPFDLDGNPNVFSSGEIDAITEVWKRVSEDYSIFNVDVTTQDPFPNLSTEEIDNSNLEARIDIGGSYSDWYGSAAGGIALVGGFGYSFFPNTAYVFPTALGNWPKAIAEASSHEAGHLFGLLHQSLWDGDNFVAEYNPGNGDWAPIMGVSYYANKTTWYNGLDNQHAIQDDTSFIQDVVNNFGFKEDDFGDTMATATTIGSTVSVSGIINDNTTVLSDQGQLVPDLQHNQDFDMFKFTTGGGTVNVSMNTDVGSNINPEMMLLDANGNVLVNSTNINNSVPAGTYYLKVDSTGGYGYWGQYTITGTIGSVAQAPNIGLSQDNTDLSSGGSVSYGNTFLGTDVSKTFTISNTGSGILNVTSVNMPAGFQYTGPAQFFALDANESATFSVKMLASAVGNPSGDITIVSNDSDQSVTTVHVSGEVDPILVPEITVLVNGIDVNSGASVDFGSQDIGNSNDNVVTIVNDGTGPLSLSSVQLPVGYSLAIPFVPMSLNVGEAVDLDVVLDTSVSGTFAGDMIINNDDSDEGQFDLSLTGHVNTPALMQVMLDGQLVTDGASFDLGNIALGSDVAKLFTISNAGESDLTVLNVTATGGYSVTGDTFGMIGSSDTLSFNVSPDTSDEGDVDGTVTVTAANSTLTMSFHANVVGSEITVLSNGNSVDSGSTLSFGSSDIGGSANQVIVIKNDGMSDLDLQSVDMPTGFTLSSTFVPVSLHSGESISLSINMDTSVSGDVSGDMLIQNNDSDESQFALMLSGHVNSAANIVVSTDNGTLANGDTIDQGNVVLDSTVKQTIVVTNTGETALNIQNVQVTGDYSLESAPSSVAPGATATIVVVADTSTEKALSGSITINSDDSDEPMFVVNLMANVVASDITVFVDSVEVQSGDSVDFGATDIGANSSQLVSIRNDGDSVLHLASISLPTGYSLAAPLLTMTLDVGQSVDFTVVMDTSVSGTFAGNLVIASDDPDEAQFVLSLTGHVNTPATIDVSLDGNAFANNALAEFGDIAEGSISSKSLIITNNGESDLLLQGITSTGPFMVTGTSFGIVKSGESVEIDVQVNTTAEGSLFGSLTIGNNVGDFNVFLHANVIGSNITMSVDGADLSSGDAVDYGSTTVGTSVSHTFTIHNTGLSNLMVFSVSLPNGYSMSSIDGTSIAPNSSLDFTVTMDASASGSFDGEMMIETNDGDESQFIVSLSGSVANAADVVVTHNGDNINIGDTVDFGAVGIGVANVQTFVVKNNGAVPLTVGKISLPTNYALVKSLGKQTLNPGESASFNVRFRAYSAGTYSGVISIPNSDLNESPFTINVTSQVIGAKISITNDDGTVNSGDSFDFGTNAIGGSSTKSFTVHNDGLSDLAVNSISIPKGFVLLQPPPFTKVHAGDSEVFVLGLNTSVAGNYSGVVNIKDNDASQPTFTLNVTGQVVGSEITITVDGTNINVGDTVDFGATTVGSMVSKTFVIRNDNLSDLVLQKVDLPKGYSLADAFSKTTLHSGESINLTVMMTAAKAGSFNGVMVIKNNDGDEGQYVINLTGTANPIGAELSKPKAATPLMAPQALLLNNTINVMSSIPLPPQKKDDMTVCKATTVNDSALSYLNDTSLKIL